MWFLIIVAVVVGLDQFVKYLVETRLPLGVSQVLVPRLVFLTRAHNSGAAFSMASGRSFVLGLVGVAALGVMLYFYRQFGWDRPWLKVGLALAAGGALGNLADRFRLGYVVDFLDVRWWPVFNVADTAIVIGVAVLVWQLWRAPLEGR